MFLSVSERYNKLKVYMQLINVMAFVINNIGWVCKQIKIMLNLISFIKKKVPFKNKCNCFHDILSTKSCLTNKSLQNNRLWHYETNKNTKSLVYTFKRRSYMSVLPFVWIYNMLLTKSIYLLMIHCLSFDYGTQNYLIDLNCRKCYFTYFNPHFTVCLL